MQRILDRLIVSSLSEASDPLFLRTNQVQAIIYFGNGGLFSEEFKLYHRSLPADGLLGTEQLRDGIEFVRESMRAGRRVLAVGATGATIVAAYLTEMGMSSAQALEMVAREEFVKPDHRLVQRHMKELERRASVTVGHTG